MPSGKHNPKENTLQGDDRTRSPSRMPLIARLQSLPQIRRSDRLSDLIAFGQFLVKSAVTVPILLKTATSVRR